MAAADHFNPLEDKIKNGIKDSKVLLIGAGGIGCELLKNLVLAGINDIHVIDLDTIDVSNLNRQFLFQKEHVGKSKAIIAKESALLLNPKVNITAYHDSITNSKFNVDFFEKFSAVLNALDNMAARKHVNRMCLAADIPLIESGSTGYLGQVTVYKKKLSECYECLPRVAPKDFPTCTIRNTPSELIHCIVWAKHLFNQLFGDEDSMEEVSPDATDVGSSPSNSNVHESPKLSTREWAKKYEYDAEKLFKKLFHEDVLYLLQMSGLWINRASPTSLDWDKLPDAVAGGSRHVKPTMKDEELWSIKECASVFENTLSVLWKKLDDPSSNGQLIWDKDDDTCMDFVTACANIRAYCFRIPQECRFKIKSMAGNIIPAIATTNAVIAGLIVLQLFKILSGQLEKCRTVILNKSIACSRKKLISSGELEPPAPNCFVCSPNASEVHIIVNVETFNVKTLQEKVIIGKLNMVEPDVIVDNGKGTLLISSDPDDKTVDMMEQVLLKFSIQTGARLQCDDYFQNFKLVLVITHNPELHDQEFYILGDVSDVKPKEEAETQGSSSNSHAAPQPDNDDDDDDIISDVDYVSFSYKRKLSDDENGVYPSKKARKDTDFSQADDDDVKIL